MSDQRVDRLLGIVERQLEASGTLLDLVCELRKGIAAELEELRNWITTVDERHAKLYRDALTTLNARTEHLV